MSTPQMKIAALCLLFVLRCSAAEPCFPEPSDGQREKYEITVHVPLRGSEKATIVTITDGTMRIAGKEYHKQVTIWGDSQETNFVRYANDGIYSIRGDDPLMEESCVVPFPVKIGKTWTKKTKKYTLQCQIVGEEDVYTEGQIYKKCIKIESKSIVRTQHIVIHSYYAPRVGLVKEKHNDPAYGVSITSVRIEN